MPAALLVYLPVGTLAYSFYEAGGLGEGQGLLFLSRRYLVQAANG